MDYNPHYDNRLDPSPKHFLKKRAGFWHNVEL